MVSKILYGFNLTAVERVEFLRDVPRGLEEAEMIMAGERFLITNLYIPYSILIWEQLNGPHYSKLKGEGSDTSRPYQASTAHPWPRHPATTLAL